MADKIVRATVTGDLPVFINGVLHLPGEEVSANLTELGVDALGKETPGLTAHSASKDEVVDNIAIAAVAPHAPGAPNPQGIAPGSRQSGTGRIILPSAGDEPPRSPVGADSLIAQAEGKDIQPDKPSRK